MNAVNEHGDELLGSIGLDMDAIIDLKIEGVVAKRKTSTYQPGVRSSDWLKVKGPGWQEGRGWRR